MTGWVAEKQGERIKDDSECNSKCNTILTHVASSHLNTLTHHSKLKLNIGAMQNPPGFSHNTLEAKCMN